MTKMDRWIISAGLALCLSFAGTNFLRFAANCAAVRGDTLRLHIIANSDSEADQKNKLLVRDAILVEYGGLLGASGDVKGACTLASFLGEDIAVTARKTLQEQNNLSDVSVSLTQMYFDTREYDDGLILPAGRYNALRVVIGDGAGQNWWCVLYPPLCVPAAMKDPPKDATARIQALSRAPGYRAGFALVELAEKLRNRFS
jgi:stage II sporulation protein R